MYITLLPQDSRLTTFPISRPGIWNYYIKATKLFWTPEEILLTEDANHYETRLTSDEQRFVKYVLAFFAASDGIVKLNLAKRFKKDIGILEADYFYDYQMMTENIHAHTYSLLLDCIIADAREKADLLNAIETMPVIAKMSAYMFRCIESSASLPERLLRMVCVEGIFFTGCFCAIYWLRSRGLMPGLGQSNEFIARDESLHTMFSLYMYTLVNSEYKLSVSEVTAIFKEAVDIAKEFICDALPKGLKEMNADLMCEYIECQADNLVTLIDYPIIYGSKHCFAFMEMINLTNRTNFFETRVTEYSKVTEQETHETDIATDF